MFTESESKFRLNKLQSYRSNQRASENRTMSTLYVLVVISPNLSNRRRNEGDILKCHHFVWMLFCFAFDSCTIELGVVIGH